MTWVIEPCHESRIALAGGLSEPSTAAMIPSMSSVSFRAEWQSTALFAFKFGRLVDFMVVSPDWELKSDGLISGAGRHLFRVVCHLVAATPIALQL